MIAIFLNMRMVFLGGFWPFRPASPPLSIKLMKGKAWPVLMSRSRHVGVWLQEWLARQTVTGVDISKSPVQA